MAGGTSGGRDGLSTGVLRWLSRRDSMFEDELLLLEDEDELPQTAPSFEFTRERPEAGVGLADPMFE